LAQWPNVLARTEEGKTAAPTAVTVRSGPGELANGRVLTWKEPDGQYWSVSGSGLASEELISIASDLKLTASAVEWPQAEAGKFERIDVPADNRTEHSDIPYSSTLLDRPGCGGSCYFGLEMSRGADPWPGFLADLRMPIRLVDLNGRLGVLAEHGEVVVEPGQDAAVEEKHPTRFVYGQTENGIPFVLSESGQGSADLLKIARSLRLEH
jgi:hypothetical protein